MTLALIVLFALSGSVLEIPRPAAGGQDQSTTQQAPAKSQEQSAEQGATPPSKTTPSASAPSKSPSTQPKAPARRRRHKKKVVQNCDMNPANASSSQQTAGIPAAASGQTAQTPCPPPKTIVRQGGTSEPSIELAGDQPPKEREATHQMLNATDANLKKLEGRQLSANQQDMVAQVRQFMQQSQTAMDAGDFARSRTLAWKAQLLSEELVKPPK